jgi:hypothetical protein
MMIVLQKTVMAWQLVHAITAISVDVYFLIQGLILFALGLAQRNLDVILALGKVELAFLGEPTQGAGHFVHFEFSSLAQVLKIQSLLRIIQGVPHETGPGTNDLFVHKIKTFNKTIKNI